MAELQEALKKKNVDPTEEEAIPYVAHYQKKNPHAERSNFIDFDKPTSRSSSRRVTRTSLGSCWSRSTRSPRPAGSTSTAWLLAVGFFVDELQL